MLYLRNFLTKIARSVVFSREHRNQSLWGFHGLHACLCFAIALPSSICAQGIEYTNGNVDFTKSSQSSDGYQVFVAKPNTYGASINQFTSLSIGAPLRIFNLPGRSSDPAEQQPAASTIVFVADEIHLSASIEVIGPAADVIFISNTGLTGSHLNAGRVSCSGCTIKNALKVSFIAGKQNLPFTGNLPLFTQVKNDGRVLIENLKAPGVATVTLAGSQVTIDGLDINTSARRDDTGALVYDHAGPLKIGTGTVQVIQGYLTWTRKNAKLENSYTCIVNSKANQDCHSFANIRGTLNAPRVNILSQKQLSFDAHIDTRVDALSVISLDNQNHIPVEGVSINSFDSTKKAERVLSGRIISSGNVDIREQGKLLLSSDFRISGSGQVSILSGKAIQNFADIHGQSVGFAGYSLSNESQITADQSIAINTEFSVSNQYGGLIRAPEIHIDSEKSVVRNGSRTPYRTTPFGRLSLQFHRSPLLSDRFLYSSDTPGFLFDSTQLGTYYLLPGPWSNEALLPVAKHTANIIGDDITLLGCGIENINPYYEFAESQNNISLHRLRSLQVNISAESSLYLGGSKIPESPCSDNEYVLNASAGIRVNGPQSHMEIMTEKLINQRYRIDTVMANSNDLRVIGNDIDLEIEQRELLGSTTAVFSPPGSIAVMGNTKIIASNYFKNLFSYVEIFGDADLDGPSLMSIGIQNQWFEKNTKTVWKEPEVINPRKPTSGLPKYNSSKTNLPRTYVLQRDPRDLDSLFHVAGDTNASAVQQLTDVINPMNYFIHAAAQRWHQDITNRHLPRAYTDHGGDDVSTIITKYTPLADTIAIETDIPTTTSYQHNDKLFINWAQDVQVDQTITMDFNKTPIYLNFVSERSGTVQYPLFQTMQDYFEDNESLFDSALNEKRWW